MKRWMKVLTLALAVGLPAVAWAASHFAGGAGCPCHMPNCPLGK